MTNPNFTDITQYRDVESLNMFAELSAAGCEPDELLAILAAKSRDNSRTPCNGIAAIMRASAKAPLDCPFAVIIMRLTLMPHWQTLTRCFMPINT